MAAYLVRRALVAVLLLFGVATITFLLIHAAPGDPSDLYLSREMGASARAAVRAAYGLDRPLADQYFRWLSGLARGELGWSISHRRPVAQVMKEKIPFTIELTLAAFVLHLLVGIGAGVLAAWRRDTLWDALASGAAFVFYSLPSFWLGALLIMVFAIHLGWLPSSGAQELIEAPATMAGALADRARHLVLPALCLALASAAATARFVRAGVLSALSQEFVLAARSRGAGEAAVLLRHALRNALLPIVTLAGMSLPFLFGGSVLVESVFSWPGMGSRSVEAVFSRDYPVVLAAQLLLAFLVVVGNFAADVGLALVDPRLREGWRP